MSAAHVVFAVANYGPLWAPAVESWLRCVGVSSRQLTVTSSGSLNGIGITDRCYTASAENRLAEGMLAIPGATHLFFTESDMILPDEAILQLLALDQPIASGVYFLRGGWGQPCLYRQIVKVQQRRATQAEKQYAMTPVSIFPQETPFKLGDHQAAGCPGFGCVLLAREVFEKMPAPWFQTIENRAGSDLYFYREAHDHGFDVWIDPRVRCAQVDYYQTDIGDYHDRLRTDPHFGASGYIVGGAP